MPDSDEDIPQNTNHQHEQENPSRRLLLTSFAHRRGPLNPKPTEGLLFDVRSLPNPQRQLRILFTGTYSELRRDLMSKEPVRKRVDEMIAAIKAHLASLDASDSGENEEVKDLEVRVGVRCELGRHRSVACVEELARVQWPEGWTVQVTHRDLTIRSSERGKEKRRARKTEEESGDE